MVQQHTHKWFLCPIFGLCSMSFFPIPFGPPTMVHGSHGSQCWGPDVFTYPLFVEISLWYFLPPFTFFVVCFASVHFLCDIFGLRSLSCQSKFVGGLSMFSPALALTNLLLLSSSHQRSFELTMLSNNFSSKTAEHQPRMSFKFASL